MTWATSRRSPTGSRSSIGAGSSRSARRPSWRGRRRPSRFGSTPRCRRPTSRTCRRELAPVVVEDGARYRLDGGLATPALVAGLAGWCEARGVLIVELRVGGSLEERYLELTGGTCPSRSGGMTRPTTTEGGAAPAWQAILAMTAMELRLALRRGETLVATAVLPVVVLVFFSSVSIVPVGAGRPVDFLLPGSIAFAIIATSLVSLGITTAYDRFYGVLKRLGGSPLSRAELIAAKILAVLVVEAVQVAVLVGAASVLLGWSAPAGRVGRSARRRRPAGHAGLRGRRAPARGHAPGRDDARGREHPVRREPDPRRCRPADLAAPRAARAPSPVRCRRPRSATRCGSRSARSGDAAGSLALLAGWGVASVGLAVATFRWE